MCPYIQVRWCRRKKCGSAFRAYIWLINQAGRRCMCVFRTSLPRNSILFRKTALLFTIEGERSMDRMDRWILKNTIIWIERKIFLFKINISIHKKLKLFLCFSRLLKLLHIVKKRVNYYELVFRVAVLSLS